LGQDDLKDFVRGCRFHFLKYLWEFKKNYIGIIELGKAQLMTFPMLFAYIFEFAGSESSEERIREICEWRVESEEDNILIALILFKLDGLAR